MMLRLLVHRRLSTRTNFVELSMTAQKVVSSAAANASKARRIDFFVAKKKWGIEIRKEATGAQ